MSRPVTVEELEVVLTAACCVHRHADMKLALAALPAEQEERDPAASKCHDTAREDFEQRSAVPELPPLASDGVYECWVKRSDYRALRTAAESRKAAFQADSFSVAAQRRRAEIDRADKAEAERDALRAQIAAAEQRGRAAAFEEAAAECERLNGPWSVSGDAMARSALVKWCRERAEEARG